MADDVEIDHERLREALENVLFEPERVRESERVQEPEEPRFVREMDPETLRSLFEGGSIDDALRRINTASSNADWCFACGASRGRTPDRPLTLENRPLSDEMINRLADEMLDAVDVR